jgi:hypothetical protein
MSELSYQRHRKRTPRFVKAMTIVNMAFGLTMLLAWGPLSPYIQDPAVKLLGGDIASDSNMFAYPFVVLWLLPFGAVAATVLARSIDKHWHARMAAVFPTVLIGSGCLWLVFLSDSLS